MLRTPLSLHSTDFGNGWISLFLAAYVSSASNLFTSIDQFKQVKSIFVINDASFTAAKATLDSEAQAINAHPVEIHNITTIKANFDIEHWLREVLIKVRVFSLFCEQAITPMESTAIGYLFFLPVELGIEQMNKVTGKN